MSLLSMASVAVARDRAGADQPLAKTAVSKMAPAAVGVAAGPAGLSSPVVENLPGGSGTRQQGDGAKTAADVAGFGQMLVAQVPSEALLAYTTLLALFSTAGVSAYNAGRWALYAAAIVACAAVVLGGYFAQRNYGFADTQSPPAPGVGSAPTTTTGPAPAQTKPVGKLHLPYLPVTTAVLAMAVYGLTVPGSPLQFAVSGTAFAICSGCLAVGGGLMMSIFAPFLGKGNAAKVVVQQPSNP